MLLSDSRYKIVEYITEQGDSPYASWFNSLNRTAAAKIVTALLRIQQGNLSNVKWFHGIGEYKIDFGPGYRIYLGKENQEIIILLGGGTKKTQKKDIDKAVFLWQEYKKRKR